MGRRYRQKIGKDGTPEVDEQGRPVMVLVRGEDDDQEDPGLTNPQPSSVGCALSASANPSLTAPKEEKKKKKGK